MATSSFTKNFVVSPKDSKEFVRKMQDNAPVTTLKGFTSKLTNLKNITIKKNNK